jgi:hypothetical protein
MKKIFLFAIISVLAGACSTPKEQPNVNANGMFEDFPVPFEADDPSLLNLAVAVTDSYFVIGARRGFMPNTYYTVLTELINPSSEDYQKRKPEVLYVAIQKEAEDDPGKKIWALHSDSSKAYITDSTGAFIAMTGDGFSGERPPNSLETIRNRDFPHAEIKPLSPFNLIAKDLAIARRRLNDYPDNDWIVLILEDGNNTKILGELLPLMRAFKTVGFKHIQVGRNLGNLDTARSVIGTFRLYDFEPKQLQQIYDELYRPLNLKMPRQVPSKD